MTPRLWFSVALRALGVWELLGATDHLVTLFNVKTGLYETAAQPLAFFTHGAVDLVLALTLLKGAPVITRYFYPDSPREPATDNR